MKNESNTIKAIRDKLNKIVAPKTVTRRSFTVVMQLASSSFLLMIASADGALLLFVVNLVSLARKLTFAPYDNRKIE